MASPSKVILIVGVILIALLIMSVSMYVYNSAASTISDSMTSLSTQEIEAFNNNFKSYEGTNTGSNVKALISRIVYVAKNNEDNEEKIPNVYYDRADKTIEYNSNIDEYVSALNKIKNDIKNSDSIEIELTYQRSGYVDTIKILYGEVGTSSIFDDFDNSSSNDEDKLSSTEINAHNEVFESYKGNITGKNVRTLISRLSSNADTNYATNVKLVPDVFDEKTALEISIKSGTETEKNVYVNSLAKVENDIESKHTYFVELSYDDSGLVNKVFIWYEYGN